MYTVITPRFPPCVVAGGGIVGQGGERIRAIIEELGCEVQVSREPLAGIAGHKRVTRWQGPRVSGDGEKCGDKDGLRPRQQAL
jgi:hypothetical protein